MTLFTMLTRKGIVNLLINGVIHLVGEAFFHA